MRLLNNLVLLQRLRQKPVSPGGIALPQQYMDDHKQFFVIARGPGKTTKNGVLIPPEVEPGDQCLLNEFHGNKLAFEDGSRRIIIDADEIVAKWKLDAT